MRKYILLLIIPFLGLILNACSDNSTEPTPVETGSLFVTSSPVGASIIVDSIATGKVTPDTIKGLSVGTHTIKLSLTDFSDTTFTVTITKDMMTSPSPVTMKSTASLAFFGPIRIYETSGTNSSQPSGLILKNGTAASLSNTDIDLYYYSTSSGSVYEIRSANMNSSSARSTSLWIGSGSNLNDGVKSPLATTSWLTKITDTTTTNYVFAFDQDLHYSKLKIVNVGGGTGVGNPAWVEIQWIYNKVANDRRFQ